MTHKPALSALRGCFWLRRHIRWVAMLALVLVGAASARAEEGAEYRGTSEQRSACTGDVFRLCWSEIPSVSRIVGCLQREKPRLSAGCRAVFEANAKTRVASTSTSWRRHRHVASAGDQIQPLAYEPRREQEANRVEPQTSMTFAAAREPSASRAVGTARPQELRSKIVLRRGKHHLVGLSRRHLASRSLHTAHCAIEMSSHSHHLSKVAKGRCHGRSFAAIRLHGKFGS
jgi:hypothetical protein